MVHGDGINRFAAVFRCGSIHAAPARDQRLPHWVWRCQSDRDVAHVLGNMYSLLCVKKAEAEVALWYLQLESPTPHDNALLFTSLRAHKSKLGRHKCAA
jgi:hypothetical protein